MEEKKEEAKGTSENRAGEELILGHFWDCWGYETEKGEVKFSKNKFKEREEESVIRSYTYSRNCPEDRYSLNSLI